MTDSAAADALRDAPDAAHDEARDHPPVETIRTPRLELVSMTIPVMRALQVKDLETAGRLAGASIEDCLADDLVDFLRYRLAQLDAEPSIQEWLGRLMILTDVTGERHAIGTIGFHGPPDDQERLEVGYRVEAPFRRQGFAREAVRAMFDWAASAHGIHRFVASVSPTNQASLNLIAGFGFRRTGEHMDEIDGLEYEFETEWPPAAR